MLRQRLLRSSAALALVLLSRFAAGGESTAPRFAADLEVIDRALAGAKVDDPWVRFGDVGIPYGDLKAYRDHLANPAAVAPPGTTFKWPGGNVYYRFDPVQVGNGTITPQKMQQFRDGAAEWTAFANLHFIENVTGQPHFITVQEAPGIGGGFSSSVGMDATHAEQFIQFDPGAWNRGTVCHEVGHALGYFHEQSRPDRDTYVTINWANIDPDAQANFTIVASGATYGTAYDFYSVMHYSRNALSNNGQDTISMQPAYAAYIDVIGNVSDRTLSKGDRTGIAAIYGSPAVAPAAVVTNTNDSGPGSLRTSIYYAFDKSTEAPPVPTTIAFHIPVSDPNYAGGTFTIKPTFPLTAPGNGTTIDGPSQTAFTGDTNPGGPEVVIDGSSLGPGIFGHGLTLRAANCAVKGLSIVGFNLSGIALFQVSDPNGSASTGNVIGGTAASARNVLSGNADFGVRMSGATTAGNSVLGNFIGTTQAGNAPQGNGVAGVLIELGAHGNTLGGSAAGAGNVISANTYHGVFIGDAGSNGNAVLGNFIGTDATGTSALANGTGLEVAAGAQLNVIGGGNVISGNLYQGIALDGAGTNQNQVSGNLIGVNAAGSAAIANGSAGISIHSGAQSNTIGGTTAGSRNVISGNFYQGVTIDGGATSQNVVSGNFIGLDKTGAVAIANGSSGLSLYGSAHDNTVGGIVAGARNVISGNTYQGLTLDGAATTANVIAGNYFGLDVTGLAARPNSSTNIAVFAGAHGNTIGGTAAGSRNFIAASPYYGISIDGTGTTGNLVQGNTIGLNVAGAAVPNGFNGVGLFAAAQSNTIGGASAGASNVIAGNTNQGVAMFDATTVRNTVSQNSIFANHFSGIEITSANNNQPAPSLSAAVLGPAGNTGGLDVGGMLGGSAPGATFRLEFFANPPGGDEGQFFAGAANVTTNGSGTATFTSPPIHLAVAVPKNYLVTATATDANGNTSRLSATQLVTATDTDSDGMPDAWESAHGLNANSAADASLDADGDQFTNLQEFKDGTDPQSAASRLTILLDRTPGNPRVSFQALAGRTYRLEYRDDLVAGAWITLLDQLSSPTTATLQLTDASAAGVAKRFYRVVTLP